MKFTKNTLINGVLIAGALALGLSSGCAQNAQAPPSSSPGEKIEAPSESTSSPGHAEPLETSPEQPPAERQKATPPDEGPSATPGLAPTPSQASPPDATLEASSDAGSGVVEESPDSEQTPPDPYVALAQFTTEIEDREPVDAISFLDNRSREIIFFTDFRGFGGQTLIHRWEYRGKVMGEVSFEVEGDRWRAWSRKQLLPVWLGDWTVSVVKPDGEVIAAESFSYSPEP